MKSPKTILELFKNITNTWKNLLHSENSLMQKTISGSFWVFSFRITDRLLRFVRTIVLARILSPSDFGVFGVALLSMSVFDVLLRPGIRAALIQKKEGAVSFSDTAWTIEVLRGLLGAGLLFFLAPFIAAFFSSPESEPILRVLGLVILFEGITNIHVVFFEKELKFSKFFKYQFSGTLVDFTVSIILALVLKNIWALVLGIVAGYAVRALVSYLIVKSKPKISFNLFQAKELFNYGRWILSSNVLILLANNIDSIFVGRILGATSLGFYQISTRVSSAIPAEMSQVLSRVTFPAYSKIQAEPAKLGKAYLRILSFNTSITFLLAGLIFVLAEDFVLVFLGDKWLSTVPVLKVLAFVGVFRVLIDAGRPLLQALGKPQLNTKILFINIILMSMFVYFFTLEHGILGAALAALLSMFISSIMFFFVEIRELKIKLMDITKIILYPATSTLIFVVSLQWLKQFTRVGLFEFLLLGVIGLVIYLFITYILGRIFGYTLFKDIKESFSSLR